MPYFSALNTMADAQGAPAFLTLPLRAVVGREDTASAARDAVPQNAIMGGANDPTADEDTIASYRRFHAERSARLASKNRRKRYLEVHPEYFDDPALEFADPVLYDRWIRRFKTTAEREAEGRAKGMTGLLQVHAAHQEAAHHPNPYSLFSHTRGPNGDVLPEDKEDAPDSKEEGRRMWEDEMTQRFLMGNDTDFDYNKVDSNPDYNDPEEERDREEAYFMGSDEDMDDQDSSQNPSADTGIQDY
ncbi:uncharacterized protein BDR25DRAFT_98223 [Lindgomyces ingoldianus]|uniref:Uncharacterized protein n=1 Tax=Lindgomyces ingoldianus TaxID=673940 RepID=A0ACB6QBL4_9PLEO|nr:uncharacterized protein BDR25DRAFT_98223 [Lindgomyces ingoldianus]KAF2464319.1 hypothetical protein BDR25DRAFT_98223 [Lindgomyces ingoldianus]